LHPGLELHKIKLLGLPADDEALVLGKNLSRLVKDAEVRRSEWGRAATISA
jgi:hypothetical protein